MQLINTKRLAGGIALAGALMIGANFGFAQQVTPQDQGQQKRGEFGHRGGRLDGMRGLGFFARNLNLNEAQKTQIEQITANYRESAKALHEQQRALGQDKDSAFDNRTFNEAAVRQAAQARANLQVELEVSRARMMSEIYAVLTPEQKTQLATERQQRLQQRQEWRARQQAPGASANPNR